MSQRYWVHSDPTTETDPPPACRCPTCPHDCHSPHPDRICDHCRRQAATWLGDLPGQYDTLRTLLEPGASTSEHVSGSRTPPLPVRLAALNLVAGRRGSTDPVHEDPDPKTGRPYADQHGSLSIVDVLGGWEQAWRDHDTRRFSRGPGRRGDTRRTLLGHVAFLNAQLDWACDHHPGYIDFATDLRHIRGETRAVIQDWIEDRRLDGVVCPRPHCGRMTLTMPAGSGSVECLNPACRAVWRGRHELARLTLILTGQTT